MAWLYTVLNPTKAAGGVWWIWYSSKCKASMAWKHPWLGYTQSWIQQKQPVEFDGFGTVANTKHPWLGYTQSWIQQKQPVEFDGFGTVANASIYGLAIHSLESNKSSRWSLMDLVCMATCSIRWTILWSTESIKSRQNQVVDFDLLSFSRSRSKSYFMHVLCILTSKAAVNNAVNSFPFKCKRNDPTE